MFQKIIQVFLLTLPRIKSLAQQQQVKCKFTSNNPAGLFRYCSLAVASLPQWHVRTQYKQQTTTA